MDFNMLAIAVLGYCCRRSWIGLTLCLMLIAWFLLTR